MAFTLKQMSDFITNEMGLFDADSSSASIPLCKSFLDKAYRVLWDKYPWKDGDMYAETTVPANHLNAPYPANMERVISLRARSQAQVGMESELPDVSFPPGNSARMLEPIDGTFLIQTNPFVFEKFGFVTYYEDISTSAVKQLRLYPVPSVDTELLWLGKQTCPGLVADTDTSQIRNIDEAIIAYAYCDMLQRQRQYAKADLKRKEAQELEQNAWNLEQQQVNKQRVIKTTTVAGNSLLEMTDAVCALCNQWTPEIRLIINEFVRRNYQQLYDLFLWPESLVAVYVTYSDEQVILPHYIDRVIGIRGANQFRMTPADAGLILDITPTAFEDFGDPVHYITLTPVAVATLPSSTSALTFASTSNQDKSQILIRGEVIGTGQEIAEQINLNGTGPQSTRYAYDVPITIAKDQTIGDVTINAAVDGASLGMIPWFLREQKHQRLWFRPFPNPADPGGARGPTTALVLGKRAIQTLLSDQDTPIITGIQQVVIAAAAADLYLHLQKPDLAQAYQTKADGAIKILQAKNTDQAANSPRFVPEIEPRAYMHNAECHW